MDYFFQGKAARVAIIEVVIWCACVFVRVCVCVRARVFLYMCMFVCVFALAARPGALPEGRRVVSS